MLTICLSAELWTAIDANLGVVIATLPFLRPYLHMIGGSPSEQPADVPPERSILKTSGFVQYGFTRSELEGTAGQGSVSNSEKNNTVDDEGMLANISTTASRNPDGSRYADGGSEIELTGT